MNNLENQELSTEKPPQDFRLAKEWFRLRHFYPHEVHQDISWIDKDEDPTLRIIKTEFDSIPDENYLSEIINKYSDFLKNKYKAEVEIKTFVRNEDVSKHRVTYFVKIGDPILVGEREKDNSRQREILDLPSLSIREPDGDKHYMITFTAKSEIQADIYNQAVEDVLKRFFGPNTAIFHQIIASSHNGNNPDGWEVWIAKDKTTQETLKNLLPHIYNRASEILIRGY